MAYIAFFVLVILLAIQGLRVCLVAHILLFTFRVGSKKWNQLSSPVTMLENLRSLYLGNIFNNFLAHFTRSCFCFSVNKCGIHLAAIFLTLRCFFRIVNVLPVEMPVYLAFFRNCISSFFVYEFLHFFNVVFGDHCVFSSHTTSIV